MPFYDELCQELMKRTFRKFFTLIYYEIEEVFMSP
jgi:hypothetical protein